MKFAKFTSLASWGAVAVLLCLWQPCQAQFSSNVQGTVTDSSGAVVPKVQITLHNIGTGVDLHEVTNGNGFYRFSSVAPDDYTVSTQAAGFKSESIAVTLTTAETRGLDISLSLAGAGTTNVVVSGEAALLNPEETRVQNTLTSQEISQLPLPNRDVQLLLALTPGVVGYQNESPTGGYGSSIFAANFLPQYSANGEGVQGNLFLIDDLPVQDDITQGAAMILPNAEMINQVALQSQTYSTENGTSASIQTAFNTKSGTNQIHGSADYSYAGKNLGTSDQPVHSPTFIGDPTITSTDPSFHQNLLLGSMGGPIWRDRTFFFGSVEKQNAGIGGATSTNPYLTPAFAAWTINAFPNSRVAEGLNFALPTRDVGGVTKTAQDYPGMNCGTTQTVAATVGTATPLTYNVPCDQQSQFSSGPQGVSLAGTAAKTDHKQRQAKDH